MGKIEKYIKLILQNNSAKQRAGRPDKNLWLIAERGNDAEDNGIALFYYLLEHSELGIHPKYLLSRNSVNYNTVVHRIAEIVPYEDSSSYLVEPGSEENFNLLYRAGALISTHTYGFTPDMVAYHNLARYNLFKPKGAMVFLQHGINDKVESWINWAQFKPDVFVVSTKMEQLATHRELGVPNFAIQNVGLCRYDRLHQALEKHEGKNGYVLIMPTWRQWLTGLTDEEFIDTNFFLSWNELLVNRSFLAAMKEHNLKPVFYLHPELQKFRHLFQKTDKVIFADSDVQDWIIKSDMMITDFSSVYFDEAYMEKPVVFYQFDRSRYTAGHYSALLVQHTYFGPVRTTADEVAAVTKEILDGQMPPRDESYVRSFYSWHDGDQCKRTVQAIQAAVRSKELQRW